MAGSERTREATPNSTTIATATAKAGAWGWDAERTASDKASMSNIDHLRFEATINGRYHTARQGLVRVHAPRQHVRGCHRRDRRGCPRSWDWREKFMAGAGGGGRPTQ